MTEVDDIDDIDEGTVLGANTMKKRYNPIPSRAELLDEIVRDTPVKRITPSRKVISPRMKVQREEPV